MDTEKIRVFLAVVENGTISGAAERLGYTTSGISRLVASLEKETGFSLLKRYHSGVEPTPECTMLLPLMSELVAKAEKYHQISSQILGLDVGTIAVGTAYNEYYKPLACVISEFTREYPGISVQIIEGTSSRLSSLIADGGMDFSIISRRQGSFSWIPLGHDELVALVAHDHPAVKDGCYCPAHFATEPFIELYPNNETDNSLFFMKAGIKTNTRFSTCDVYAGVAMVEAGLGVTLTNNLWAKNLENGVVALPLDPPVKIDIGIATPNPELCSPAAKRFLEFATKKILKFVASQGLI